MTEFRWLAHYDDGVPRSLEPYPERTLIDYLRDGSAKWPDKPALLFKGATISYRRLDKESDAFAAALNAMGVRAGDRVAICLPNCPQFLVAEFGAWKIGAIAAPFNPTYTERETLDALQATGAETVVVLNRFYEKIKSIQSQTAVKRVIATGIKDYLPWHLRLGYTLLKEEKEGERIRLRKGDARFKTLLRLYRLARGPSVTVKPDDDAAILMSGGTTGTPKGVLGSHRGLVTAGLQLRAWLKSAMHEWTDTIMMPLPLFHTYGNTGLQSLSLINHNPILLVPNPRDIKDLIEEIKEVRPSFICTVPTLLNGIMNHPTARAGKIDFSSIKLCFSGAAALMAETKKRFEELTGGVIVEGYSLTEAQMAVIANPVRGPKKLGSIGMPLPDVDVRIVDADAGERELDLGQVGEIVIAAPQLMQGYWRRDDETRQMLRSGEGGERLLYTGDLG